MNLESTVHDVVIVGGGNAALCAALSAAEQGASVLVLERAPFEERGGNSAYTDGKVRFAYNGAEDIIALSDDLTPEEIATSDFGSYTENDFFDDMARITQHRTDPDLCEILVRNSNATMRWLKDNGVRFMPNYGRQAYKTDGKFKFWGGAPLATWGGGPGLVEALFKAVERKGVTVVYDAWVQDLIHDVNGVSGVKARIDGRIQEIRSRAVVLACGGFEANTEWRTRYLGKGWDLAKVRGTKYNTGDGLAMALNIGAQPYGHWSGCHAVGWERYATDFGDLDLTPHFQRHSYTFSIMVNGLGKRFLDEGADIRNFTYAKYGHLILEQPGQFAWQIYDDKVAHLLLDEYRTKHVTKVKADTLEELVAKLDDVDPVQALKTIKEFNAAVNNDVPFDPNIKDGKGTNGLEIPKSNWALAIDKPPFQAFAITCGVTFTFGGLKITTEGQVVDTNHDPIPGLYAAGEMVGGIFYFNYPGASGLTSGAVFGRLSGKSAGLAAKSQKESQ
ncbi:FAD-dependent tricarballylate dehydrogenase TcuA [Pigmentiphaga soli]|uniref:FAD-dependent tricarballylate dehydrogenase TcuA n=1 Tax=Pigmentiphaga soli TaxID=1007095 RepID=A0ABP8H5Q8_9BURK